MYWRKMISSPSVSYEALWVDSAHKHEVQWVDNELMESMLTRYIQEIKDFNKIYFKQKEEALWKQREIENVDINDLIWKINQNYLSNQ